MLRPQEQSGQVIEKVFRTKTGALARVRFLVVEFDGRPWFKVLSVQPITQSGVTALPIYCARCDSPEIKSVIGQEIESPYFDLTFFVSQPTRAPSIK